MKRREWNEEQLEQLLQQLPSVKDKRTASDIYQEIQITQMAFKKKKSWLIPAIATVMALLIFAIISPNLFQSFLTSNEESAMDMDSNSLEESSKLEESSLSEKNMQESSLANEETADRLTYDREKIEEIETFVTSAKDSEKIITIGLIDEKAQNILPISVEGEVSKEKLEQIKELVPESLSEQLGPVSFLLFHSDFYSKENTEEIIIEYKGEPSVASSAGENNYKESIQETFRWLGYNKADLFTNGNEGIEFGNSGLLTELEINEKRNKAYLIYQYDETTSKLLVPTPEPIPTINKAIDIMKKGLPTYNLFPSILTNIEEIVVISEGQHLELKFNENIKIENNEQGIIMLEALLLTAKDFGYKTVQFNGIEEPKIGLMDVTKPIDVPFSPNPIK